MGKIGNHTQDDALRRMAHRHRVETEQAMTDEQKQAATIDRIAQLLVNRQMDRFKEKHVNKTLNNNKAE